MDHPFRLVLIVGACLLLPIMLYHRLQAHTGETLDRRQEGLPILITLRPVGFAMMAGLIAYMINPASMAWSSFPSPVWLRWVGVGIGGLAGVMLLWTLSSLGKNLTDTVVTRRVHTMVASGPYRWVRHPFYICVALTIVANGLVAANWFLLGAGAVVVALLVVRTRREEQKLIERFGDSYRGYMERTGRFLPRIRSRSR
ncbi:MAG: isoprenylcysteine carboxylmethyltransferase family protein [Acidobacteria bacterium]|nr:isoprenylcysteine carboxylmethyltransferase family protein [Acidobacteriota bacterium]